MDVDGGSVPTKLICHPQYSKCTTKGTDEGRISQVLTSQTFHSHLVRSVVSKHS